MVDMREYKETVKAAVARERQADENWSWRVASVTKGAAKIGWGYIDYEKPLDPETAAGYALVADGVGCTGCVNEAASRDIDCCWDCNRNPRRKRQDLYRHRQPEVSGHD